MEWIIQEQTLGNINGRFSDIFGSLKPLVQLHGVVSSHVHSSNLSADMNFYNKTIFMHVTVNVGLSYGMMTNIIKILKKI
jgi:hypothetical protein